ncbi:MAG TPA: polysaccharide biosynthesis protein, partial [Rhodocyclaceae bacterium]|nr:polysaccharide biosynthesis protein [Rhodocyclaceae bacterium]
MDRSLMIFLHDLLMAVLAWIGAYWLRSNLEAPPDFRAAMVNTLAIVAAVQGIVFYAFGLYRGVWRFASVSDLKRILLAVGVAALATPTMLTMAQQHAPRSVYILDPLLLVMLMGGVRFTYRAWKDGHFFLRRTGVGTPVLIVGVGESAMGLIKTLATNQTWRVVGFVHTRANQAGRQIGGVPILGGLDHIAQHAER